MITPQEITDKAHRIYPRAVEAWILGETGFFPYRMLAKLKFPKSTTQPQVIQAVDELRRLSKATQGFGYMVQFDRIKSRSHGENAFPTAIFIESLDDLLRLTKKQREFQSLASCVSIVRDRLPALEVWLPKNWRKLVAVAAHIEGLVQVVEYVLTHPRPNCYLREIPLAIPTKLIEQNKPLLREWLDRVLPPEHISFGVDATRFEARYGFRYPRRHLLVRLLDPSLQSEFGFPCDELSLPAEELAKLPVADVHVAIVENKINLLTLPISPRGIVLGGLGNNIEEFDKLDWLKDRPIVYWGDIDVEGLAILSRFRRSFPQTLSAFMDLDTLHAHRELWSPPSGTISQNEPGYLKHHELEAYRYCRQHNVRLEQERIPQSYVESPDSAFRAMRARVR